MNKTTSIATISLVALALGMSAVVPAAMGVPNNPNSKATEPVCHRGGVATPDDASDDQWVVLYVKQNALKGHLGHDDLAIPGDVSEADCPNQFVYWSPPV